jgi:hypothetical protein
MRGLIFLFFFLPACALAQELSAEHRACITAAAGKLPTIAALEIKGSRALARPVQEQRKQKLHSEGSFRARIAMRATDNEGMKVPTYATKVRANSARSVLQDGRFDATESITVCAVNTDPAEAPLFRVPTAPNQRNGLDARRFDA